MGATCPVPQLDRVRGLRGSYGNSLTQRPSTLVARAYLDFALTPSSDHSTRVKTPTSDAGAGWRPRDADCLSLRARQNVSSRLCAASLRRILPAKHLTRRSQCCITYACGPVGSEATGSKAVSEVSDLLHSTKELESDTVEVFVPQSSGHGSPTFRPRMCGEGLKAQAVKAEKGR